MTAEGSGRRVRDAQRTRAAIVQALLDAFQDGEPRPTAKTLAERAGISVRSIYVHFADLDELRLEVARIQAERIAETLPVLDAAQPLADRVDALTAALAELYPFQGVTRLVAMVDSYESAALDDFLRAGEDRQRDYLRAGFAPEVGDDPDRLAALAAITAPMFRFVLVERQGLTVEAACRVVGETIRRVLDS